MQRLVTFDDHTGETITEGIDKTQASLRVARNGQTITWDALNLTDASWDALTAMLRAYLPDTEPEVTGYKTDDTEPAAPPAEPAAPLAERAAEAAAERAAEPEPAPATAPAAPADGSMTQAQRKALSKATRAWWYALTPQTLKALDLPTPNRQTQLGKLPEAVVAAYAASRA